MGTGKNGFTITVRAVDPFGQLFRPTGVELPGWTSGFLAVNLAFLSKV